MGLGAIAVGVGAVAGFHIAPGMTDRTATLAAMAWAALCGLLAALPPLATLWLAYRSRRRSVVRFRRFVEKHVAHIFVKMDAIELASLAMAAGVGEELLFRGLIQGGLAEWLGGIGGLLAASLLFGLAHFLNRTYFILTLLMGLYLGGLFLLTQNLMAPIVTHAVYDFVALLLVSRHARKRLQRHSKSDS